MKGFTFFLWPTLFVRPLLAAEPRGCIRPGTCPEYGQRMGDDIVATQRIARGAAEGFPSRAGDAPRAGQTKQDS